MNRPNNPAGGIMLALRRLAGRLVSDRAGNILPMAAAGLLVMLAMIGGGVDLSRSYRVQSRLQSACDSATLAGRKAVTTNGYDTTASNQATSYFNVNFDQSRQGARSVSFSSTSPDNGITVIGTAQAVVPMVVMEVFGKQTMTLNAQCQATMGIGNVDVTFALDTTGSMNNALSGSTRIGVLRTAAKSFYATLATSTSGTSARVRYAFVPYSTTVNVGSLLYSLNPAYITNVMGMQSAVARSDTANTQKFTGYSKVVPVSEWVYYSTPNSAATQISATSYASEPACLTAMPADTAWSNNGSSATTNFNTNIGSGSTKNVYTTKVSQPRRMTSYTCDRVGDLYYVYYYYAYQYYNTYTYTTGAPTVASTTGPTVTFNHFDYKMVKYDTSTFKTFAAVTTNTGSSGAAQTSTWDGCIEERYTVSDAAFTYNTSTGRINSTAAADLDIDTAPTGDNATKWAPQWGDVANYRTDSAYSYLDNVPVSIYGDNAYYACPSAAQGLTAMTSTEFGNYVDALNPQGNTYHAIGMLWAARLSSTTGIFSSTVNAVPSNGQSVSRHIIFMTDGDQAANYASLQAYGIEFHDKRVTDDGYTNDDARHINRFRALCDAVKGKGIRVWVIALATSLNSDLTYCATANSSYTATSAASLNTAFQTIAKQIGELRVYR